MSKSTNSVDLIGRIFGHLTVMSKYSGTCASPKWVCLCDCGNVSNAVAYNLINGRATCCGPNHSNMIGITFGSLTVIERKENSQGDNNRNWLCNCSCGGKRIVTTTNLRTGKISHCGCIKKIKYVDRTIPAINILIGVYKRIARIKQREYTLSREQFIAITSSSCHYCGEPPISLMEDNLRGNEQINKIL
jgi:hypothetical protein